VDKVISVVSAVNRALEGGYAPAVHKLQLYLTKPKTQQVLLKPIKANVMEAHGHFRTLLQQHYTAEQAATVPLRSVEEVQTLLDAV
jgi:conserved oligomeric Golgi complex subunit 3